MMKRFQWKMSLLTGLLSVGLLCGCIKEEIGPATEGPSIDLKQIPYPTLSDYQFFEGDLQALSPSEGVVPFDLATPLFTDYAQKARFVYIPEGEKIAYEPDEALGFPVGSILIKNFFYYADEASKEGKRIIETRLLVHKNTGWEAYGYIWNEEQTEANYTIVGKTIPLEFKDKNGEVKNVNYLIPNKNDCKSCHNVSGVLTPLGPKTRNLNTNFAYAQGEANQLAHWQKLGWIELPATPDELPRAAQWNNAESGTLDDRARAYLDVNCGHCHRPEGAANNSGLFLYTNETDLNKLGYCKKPVAAGKGSGGLKYDIVPGDAMQSILMYRLASVTPDIAMPELGRSLPHEEGINLIKDWINAMEESACE